MNLFETIKSAVTMKQAAEFCGMKIERNGTCHCPFHSDRTPSMKLYPDHYYCFSCHEHGDAVSLTAKLCNLPPKDAAIRLAEAYHVDISACMLKKNGKKPYAPFVPRKPDLSMLAEKLAGIKAKDEKRERAEWLKHAQDVLIRYMHLICEWKDKYAPITMEEEWHPLYMEACQQEAMVQYMLELTDDPLERDRFYIDYDEEMKRIERRIDEHMAAADERGCA